ncbi:hypothetical protein [Nocardioides deserti]|uniref:Uncharacterized protein n=1 Tax=Nocardioides deserti TaxID=1588644 RepID=A0ABR6U867_9ACTN|nr:hypothetical protein [Nocardioides deserti]MBC2960615.1 hypothetical protein [Nocardioides deserti]GGO70861.1 hypothetical protein GCM10012276_10420 [Nocardioides deserti]
MSNEHPNRPESDRLPSTNHPIGGQPRRRLPAIIAVVGLVVAVALIVAVLTWTRYNT